jgi:hypothetical protein
MHARSWRSFTTCLTSNSTGPRAIIERLTKLRDKAKPKRLTAEGQYINILTLYGIASHSETRADAYLDPQRTTSDLSKRVVVDAKILAQPRAGLQVAGAQGDLGNVRGALLSRRHGGETLTAPGNVALDRRPPPTQNHSRHNEDVG